VRWIENERAANWVVGLAAAVIYLNALPNGFVFDDLLVVRDNPYVNQPRWVLHAFTTDYWRGTSVDMLYRPLAIFSYGLNSMVHGMRPFGFHLVNVGLHVIISLLVVRLTKQLFANHRLAWITGLLFALHPIHTEAVTSIVGRAELLIALFSLLAICLYLDARVSPLREGRRKFALCLVCYLLAALSKENGITVPALILLAEITQCLAVGNRDRFRGQGLRRTLLCYGVLAGVAAVYLLVRFAVLGNLTLAYSSERAFTVRGTLIGFPWPLQFANALEYFALYLKLLIFPLHLCSDYSYNQLPAHGTIWHWGIGVGALALLAMIVTAVAAVRRAPPLFFGITFFLLAFLPSSNFIIPILTTLAERTMYLPSFGFLLSIAWAINHTMEKEEQLNVRGASVRRPAWAFGCSLLVLILAFYSVRTVLRNRDWRNEIALFSSATRVSPQCANAWNCLADALAEAGRFEEAIRAYDRSLEIIPDHGVFFFRKAKALLQWGKRDEAMRAFERAIQYEPRLSDAADQLSRIYSAMGRWDDALPWALKAVGIQPGWAPYHFNLGYVLQKQGKLREAQRQYREAARINPAEPSYVFNLGLIARDTGDFENAAAHFQKAVELSPDNEKYWMSLADALLKKGALPAAAIALEEFSRRSTNAALVAEARRILGQIRPVTPP